MHLMNNDEGIINNGGMSVSNAIEIKSFEFAIEIVQLTRRMMRKDESALTNQLLRSGTSIGANVSEAQFAQSKKDFASKMTIALKEANETKYWIRLLKEIGSISAEEANKFLLKLDEIFRLLISIVKSSKE